VTSAYPIVQISGQPLRLIPGGSTPGTHGHLPADIDIAASVAWAADELRRAEALWAQGRVAIARLRPPKLNADDMTAIAEVIEILLRWDAEAREST
jgi:hypothetical protein